VLALLYLELGIIFENFQFLIFLKKFYLVMGWCGSAAKFSHVILAILICRIFHTFSACIFWVHPILGNFHS